MKKITLVLSVLFILLSCNQSHKINLNGSIKGSESNEMIYLAHQGLKSNSIIDSVKINKNKGFKFTIEKPEFPDFYALIYKNQTLLIAIDTIGTINLEANAQNFATQFTIENSTATEKIRQLRNSATRVAKVLRSNQDTTMWRDAIIEHQTLAKEIVLQNTHGLAAYFAIHQTLGEFYFLSPSDTKQIRYWQAVATGFEAYYPKSERSIQLKKTTLDAIKSNKEYELRSQGYQMNVQSENFIEIALPNRSDETTTLSSLKGKTVLLNFMAFGVENALSNNLLLGEIYEQYHSKGLEVYQVSLDQDKLFWLKSSYNLPWICVFDQNSANSIYARNYNVTQLPSLFIINKEGEIVKRASISDAKKWLSTHL